MSRTAHHDEEAWSEEGLRLQALARSVIEAPSRIRKLAQRDQVAIALILDRREFLPDGEFTMLQAVHHLGEQQVRIAIAVERALMLSHLDD